MDILSKLLIRIRSRKVGVDEFGNEYFQNNQGKRFVVYHGISEPSKVPAEWHGWLHYSTDVAPVNINTHRYSWQKIHLPNLTGTKNAHSPKKNCGKTTSAEYEAWNPNG